MLYESNRKGFTLIELLVVISIIGVLVRVVIAELNSAREKANDTKVQEQLDSVRKNAALYYSVNGNYGIASNFCVLLSTDPNAPFFQDIPSGMSAVTNQAIYPSGTTLECRTNGQDYVMVATMSNGKSWCIDSTGASKEITDTQLDTGSKFSCGSGASSDLSGN